MVFVVLFYVFYTTPEDCTENKFFISFNMILCFAVSVVSIIPKVQVLFFFAISFWHTKQETEKGVIPMQTGRRVLMLGYHNNASWGYLRNK